MPGDRYENSVPAIHFHLPRKHVKVAVGVCVLAALPPVPDIRGWREAWFVT